MARGSTRRRLRASARVTVRAMVLIRGRRAPRARAACARVRERRDFVHANGHHESVTARCSSAPRALADHSLSWILPVASRGVSLLSVRSSEERMRPARVRERRGAQLVRERASVNSRARAKVSQMQCMRVAYAYATRAARSSTRGRCIARACARYFFYCASSSQPFIYASSARSTTEPVSAQSSNCGRSAPLRQKERGFPCDVAIGTAGRGDRLRVRRESSREELSTSQRASACSVSAAAPASSHPLFWRLCMARALPPAAVRDEFARLPLASARSSPRTPATSFPSTASAAERLASAAGRSCDAQPALFAAAAHSDSRACCIALGAPEAPRTYTRSLRQNGCIAAYRAILCCIPL